MVETSEANNTRWTPITVSPPDLTVAALSAPPRGGAGLPVVVTDTTRNQTGVGPAAASATRFYLARSSVLAAGDPSIGERAIPPLAPGASNVGTTTLTIPPATTAGAYFIVAKADGPGALLETLDGNNTRAAAIAIGPDLAVTAMSAPATGGAGLPLTVTDTVTNQAGGAAASSTLRFYLSTNTTFGAGDVLLGSRLVPSLAPGANSPGSTSLTIPPGTAAGMYYIVAIADAAGEVAEINEANNTRAVVVKVMPDLVVMALAAPASASAGATISVTDTTKNQGEGTAAATTTRFYLSTNATYDLGDVSLGSRAVPSLATLQASTATITLTIPAGTPPEPTTSWRGRTRTASWRKSTRPTTCVSGTSRSCRENGSVGLDGERRVLRPLPHGPVVERQVVVAELVQHEEIDRGRDAATAIADHPLVRRDALRPELRRRRRPAW